MTAVLWVLVAALVAASPADKDKDKDKKKPADRPAAVAGPDLMQQAEEKAAAGDSAAAADLLRKAAAQAGAGGEPSLRLGRVLEGRHELDAALDAYAAAAPLLSGPAKGEALARLALVQQMRGVAEWTASAEAAAAADPDGAWPACALAAARAREGKADEAQALARKALAAGAGACAQVALGAAHEAAKDLAAAEQDYRAAGGAEALDPAAAIGLARVLRQTGRAAEAEPLLQKVLADSPGAVGAYKESARARIALGRGTDAMGDAATAAALAENDPDAQALAREVAVARALELVARQQSDMALSDLTRFRDSQPDSAVVRVGMGRVLIARRQADAAIVELQKAVELDPALAEAHYRLGLARHVNKQDAVGALPSLQRAAELEPANAEYRISLGAALVDAKQFDRAVSELGAVTRTAPERAEGWTYLGAAQLQAKRYKDAVAALDRAAALAPQSAQVESLLAWSYFGLKDAARFKLHGGKARALGHKEATLLQYLARIEAGEPIK